MIDRTSRTNLLLATSYGIEQRVGGGRYVQAIIVAVKAVIAAASAINEMKAENDKAAALQEISSKLSAIISQLGKIRRDLAEIKQKLDEIEEKLDQQPFVVAALENAGLQELIAENYSFWASKSAKEVDLDEARRIRTTLAKNNRILMSGRKMSYAFDLIFSFTFELDMALLLDVPDDSLRNAALKMISYLEEVNDPNINESIAFYYAASRPTYDALLQQEAALDGEDFLGTELITTYENQWGGVRCTIDRYQIIDGSLKERDLQWKIDWRNERNCFGFDKPKDQPWRSSEAERDQSERTVPHHSYVENLVNRFIPHADVVEFAEEAMPAVKTMIVKIKTRLEKQLTHGG